MRRPPQFIKDFLLTAVGAGVAIYVLIIVIDPYMNLGVYKLKGRQPVSQNQRFAYPALARRAGINSVIVGTSTTRLIDPASLSIDGFRFVNLSMNSATAYEQKRILELFLRHHSDTRAVVVGVDRTWCQHGEEIEQLTFREFPEWMYDDNPVNDFAFMFNDKALENTVRMAQLLLGYRQPKYRADGYRDFTLDFGQWRSDEVRDRIYRGASRSATAFTVRPTTGTGQFPLVESLRALVDSAPASARVIIVLPPLHQAHIARHNAELSPCKGAVLTAFSDDSRTAILDYLFSSEVTTRDENYWDQLHFTREVARQVEQDIAGALDERPVRKYTRLGAELNEG